MAGPYQLNRWLIIAAGVVLAATAALHATGYSTVSSAILASGAGPFLVAAVRALWLMVSVHLVVLSVVVILASGVAGARWVVLACALIPAADTVLLFRFVGLFVGSFALAGATALLILGVLLPSRRAPSSGGA